MRHLKMLSWDTCRQLFSPLVWNLIWSYEHLKFLQQFIVPTFENSWTSRFLIETRCQHLKATEEWTLKFLSVWLEVVAEARSSDIKLHEKYKCKVGQLHSGTPWNCLRKLLSPNCCAKIDRQLHIIKFSHEYTAWRVRQSSGRETCSS